MSSSFRGEFPKFGGCIQARAFCYTGSPMLYLWHLPVSRCSVKSTRAVSEHKKRRIAVNMPMMWGWGRHKLERASERIYWIQISGDKSLCHTIRNCKFIGVSDSYRLEVIRVNNHYYKVSWWKGDKRYQLGRYSRRRPWLKMEAWAERRYGKMNNSLHWVS